MQSPKSCITIASLQLLQMKEIVFSIERRMKWFTSDEVRFQWDILARFTRFVASRLKKNRSKTEKKNVFKILDIKSYCFDWWSYGCTAQLESTNDTSLFSISSMTQHWLFLFSSAFNNLSLYNTFVFTFFSFLSLLRLQISLRVFKHKNSFQFSVFIFVLSSKLIRIEEINVNEISIWNFSRLFDFQSDTVCGKCKEAIVGKVRNYQFKIFSILITSFSTRK